jgi:hypothetical protein
MFENGVRLNIEMQDHLEADMEQLPRCQLPEWMKNKLAYEKKKLAESLEDAQSDGPITSVKDKTENQDVDMEM